MSSKKPFEHIEEKIKQAADNSLPAFDEKAWKLLEAKLDKNNKKRRPFLWWFILPLALAGAGAVYYNLKNKAGNKSIVTHQQKSNNTNNVTHVLPGEKLLENTASNTKDATNGINTNSVKSTKDVNTKKQQETESKYPGINSSADRPALSKKQRTARYNKGKLITAISAALPVSEDNTNSSEKEIAVGQETENIEGNTTKDEKIINTNTAVEQKNENTIPGAVKEEIQTVKKEETKKEDITAVTKKQKNKQPVKGIYFIAAAGLDAGGTKLLSYENSKGTPKYGLGIGYQFNNRWSVQSGFYSTNKKYIASSKDYNIKPGSPMASYPIEQIMASCRVYEIPLTIRYNVLNKSSLTLYATAGAASYIMQKENYDCYYRYYNNWYDYEWGFSGNKHLFSTAIFSFGIEKPLSSKISLLAEPSISIPLTGVGEGKMKIYSSAALLGIKYFPFKK